MAGKHQRQRRLIQIALLTELHNDLAEIVWMSRPRKESNIANFPLILWFAAEDVFLHIGYRLKNEADREEDHPSDVASRAKIGLLKASDIGRVEDSDW